MEKKSNPDYKLEVVVTTEELNQIKNIIGELYTKEYESFWCKQDEDAESFDTGGVVISRKTSKVISNLLKQLIHK